VNLELHNPFEIRHQTNSGNDTIVPDSKYDFIQKL